DDHGDRGGREAALRGRRRALGRNRDERHGQLRPPRDRRRGRRSTDAGVQGTRREAAWAGGLTPDPAPFARWVGVGLAVFDSILVVPYAVFVAFAGMYGGQVGNLAALAIVGVAIGMVILLSAWLVPMAFRTQSRTKLAASIVTLVAIPLGIGSALL